MIDNKKMFDIEIVKYNNTIRRSLSFIFESLGNSRIKHIEIVLGGSYLLPITVSRMHGDYNAFCTKTKGWVVVRDPVFICRKTKQVCIPYDYSRFEEEIEKIS